MDDKQKHATRSDEIPIDRRRSGVVALCKYIYVQYIKVCSQKLTNDMMICDIYYMNYLLMIKHLIAW